ncbi:hypothetical protein NQ318_008250 [Aromia moschata]|uniref:Methenyltetrahydrofolate synthase domain-containing protein n=1 Tax=Aromia moschata TaxID=1265417 RepID=A0AAV8Y670_9CUCU|nr:hypothetical protein NQ318_008250 [Aromia moschata]
MSQLNETSIIPKNQSRLIKKLKKETYRKKVWDQLVKNKVASFPNPYGRIPNFKGAAQAAAKLLELEEFKSSQSVEVNPDKPLEASRMIVLENGKELYVPVPGLQEYVLKKLSVQDGTTIKRTVSRWGIDNTGQKIDITDTIRIDLLVLGSVAVSKEGYRIGKGKGYADIEYALLKEMKAIDDETVIVTVVHDLQVFDTLPKEAFKEHDVPVDYILTPTQIIKTENRLPRPAGIYWELLSQKQINSIKVLRTLKKRHKQNNPSADTSETKPAVTHKERKKAKLTKTGNENSSGETVLSENTENIPPKKIEKEKT